MALTTVDERAPKVPGVEIEAAGYFDLYRGDMESLVATGIASADMFPGRPGRPAYSVTYPPATGTARGEGWLGIERVSRSRFLVRLRVADHIGDARLAELSANRSGTSAQADRRGGHLRLVWSAK